VFLVVALLFPVLLLLAALGMERVERPLDRAHVHHQIQRSLAHRESDPAILEGFVADSYRSQIGQYWRRQQRSTTRRPRRSQAPAIRTAPSDAPATPPGR
jgi:hypothetical protein